MENLVVENIKKRIEELDLTPEGAARRCGLTRDYFRKLFERPHASPRGVTLAKIAQGLATTPEALMGSSAAPRAPMPPAGALPYDVPVMGTAAGSHIRGAFQLTPGPVDIVRRPPALMGARDLYALYVEGTSMEPRFHPGDLIYVHPRKPPRVNDPVVVQCFDGSDDEIAAMVGIFLKWTPTHLHIAKYNPQSEVQILRETVKAVHKVLSTNELFGV